MSRKLIVCDEETRILHNKVKAVILENDPKIKNLPDTNVTKKAYKKYLEVVKNG